MSWGLIVKLHQALGVDLVRLCANLETISTHLFGGVGKVNLVLFIKVKCKELGLGLEEDTNFYIRNFYIR